MKQMTYRIDKPVKTYNGVDTFVSGIGTVRECIDCGALIAGGPTRCIRCAETGAPKRGKNSAVWLMVVYCTVMCVIEAVLIIYLFNRLAELAK